MTHSVGRNSLAWREALRINWSDDASFFRLAAQLQRLIRTALHLKLISTLSDRTRKRKLLINAFSKTTKREIERLPKTEEKISVDKKKTATDWTCMYDFIRPKMETYFSRHYGDQKFEFLTSLRMFVSLQIRARAHFFLLLRYHIDKRARSRGKRKKKHQKCSEEFKWFKVFRGAGFVRKKKGETKQWYENLLMKFFLRDFRTRKTKNRRIFWRQGETLSSGRVFVVDLGHEGRKITTKPERTTSNVYYTILGCPLRPWSNISITYDENV